MPANDHYQISVDRTTVWINGPDGSCVGRFSPTAYEVHKDVAAQLAGGSQCLLCAPRSRDFAADWATFVAGMAEHYGVEVGDRYKPADATPRLWG